MNPNRNLLNDTIPISHREGVGSVFDFTLMLKDVHTGDNEMAIVSVAAYDFEQACENLQKRFPQLEGMIDELRIRKAGEDAIRLHSNEPV